MITKASENFSSIGSTVVSEKKRNRQAKNRQTNKHSVLKYSNFVNKCKDTKFIPYKKTVYINKFTNNTWWHRKNKQISLQQINTNQKDIINLSNLDISLSRFAL